jgi:hypothetical protein
MNIRAALDCLNFLLADVKDELGPFLAIYIMSTRHWDAATVEARLTTRFIDLRFMDLKRVQRQRAQIASRIFPNPGSLSRERKREWPAWSGRARVAAETQAVVLTNPASIAACAAAKRAIGTR